MAKEPLLPVSALPGPKNSAAGGRGEAPSEEIWPPSELRLSHAFTAMTSAFCLLLSPLSAVVSARRRQTDMPDWIGSCFYLSAMLLFLVGKLQLVIYAAAAGDPAALRRLRGPAVALMTATLVPALAAVVVVAVAVCFDHGGGNSALFI